MYRNCAPENDYDDRYDDEDEQDDRDYEPDTTINQT